MVADFVTRRVLASRRGSRAGLPGPEVWLLIRRPLPAPGQSEPSELKYYLSNAPADTPLAELIRVCGMRWPIACCFEEGKGQVGMDHYAVRLWRGWYHHMTRVILAHHFLVRLRQRLMQRDLTPTTARASSPLVAPPERERGARTAGRS
jgi:SRSO17 transposase